jgi:hypothetical protein
MFEGAGEDETDDEVRCVDRAVDRLATLDPESLHDDAVASTLVALRRVRARLAGVESRLLAAVDRRRPFAEHGYLTTAAWLAASDNTPLPQARRDVGVARRLGSMPATSSALAAGEITVGHARRLADLAGPSTAVAFGDSEEFLVAQARDQRWADFVRVCTYWRRQARADAPDPDATDREHRRVDLHDGLRGTGILAGELTPIAKATVRAELHRLERELFEADWAAARAEHGDAATSSHLARTARQRRHDALVEMAQRSATAPSDGKRPLPLVTVLCGYQAFAQICELADGTLLSPATVAGLLDDAVIERIVFDGPSRVLDLGRARRFVGAARRAVEVRDRHCTGPGCHIPAHRCHIDHIHRYRDGGTTHPDNGQALCAPHNRLREHPPHTTAPPPNPTDNGP